MGEEEFRIDVKKTKETGEIVLDSFAGSGVVGGGSRIKFETKLHPDRTCVSEYC